MSQAEIGLIGLAVMGQNLVLNMSDNNVRVAVYNRSTDKVDAFLNGSGNNKNISGCYSIEELVSSLQKPRRVMLMVRAGDAVDATLMPCSTIWSREILSLMGVTLIIRIPIAAISLLRKNKFDI